MPYFASALSRWMRDTPDLTVASLAEHTGLPASDLSRIRAGSKTITLKALVKLLPYIEQRTDREAARALLISYLRDETPEGFEKDIQIQSTSSLIRESGPTDPLDAMAQRWRERAERDQDFAEMWITLDGYMHSTQESTDNAIEKYRLSHSNHISEN